MIQSTDPAVGYGRGHDTSRLACGPQTLSEFLPVPIIVHQAMGGFNQHGAQRRIGGSDQARVGLPLATRGIPLAQATKPG